MIALGIEKCKMRTEREKDLCVFLKSGKTRGKIEENMCCAGCHKVALVTAGDAS